MVYNEFPDADVGQDEFGMAERDFGCCSPVGFCFCRRPGGFCGKGGRDVYVDGGGTSVRL